MLRIAICDDSELICSEIEQILITYSKINSLLFDIEIFTKGENLIKFIKNEHDFELIFLDIELGTTTGIDIGTTIRNELDNHISKIVFISSVDGYEMNLFKIQPLDFLKKPLSENDIYKNVHLAIKLFDTIPVFFEFKLNKSEIKINTTKILYFESFLRKVKIVTVDEVFTFYSKISTVKKLLPSYFFIPHSSYIVNYNRVKLIYADKIKMENNFEIPISRHHKKNVQYYQIEIIKKSQS